MVKDTVIARCRRCRSYIHPYVTFIEGGNRWKCTMCNLSNEVPQLFDWNQETNQPADRWQRSELNHSVVEFVAPTEYMVRPPQPPCYVFLIDCSEAAVKTGQSFPLFTGPSIDFDTLTSSLSSDLQACSPPLLERFSSRSTDSRTRTAEQRSPSSPSTPRSTSSASP